MDDPRKRFAEEVKSAMEELNVSVADLAALLKLPAYAVYEIRARGLTPRSKLFLPVCEELGLDPSSFGFSDEDEASATITGTARRTLAGMLHSARIAQRLSIRKASLLLGIGETTLRHYEDGYHLPLPQTLEKLCHIYRLDLDELRALRTQAAKE